MQINIVAHDLANHVPIIDWTFKSYTNFEYTFEPKV